MLCEREKTLDTNQKDVNEIAQGIKRYLNRYPHAADTAEGVIHWLAKLRYEETLSLVRLALLSLVEEGFVSKTTQADGKTLFRRMGDS